MERLADDTIESFMNAIEERLAEGQKNKIPFSRFLEEKMDAFDYSNTSLAKKVFHRVEKKKEGTVTYVPVTRQASEPGFGVPCHLPEISMLHLEWHFR